MTHGGNTSGGVRRQRGHWVHRWGAALTAAAIAVALTSCSTTPAPTTPRAPRAPAISAATSKPPLPESETVYATYLEKLTADQRAVRENLSPDSLAGMTDAQVTEAFTIRVDEVATKDGQVDPKKYAEAFAARSQAILSAGCSLKEYSEAGGLAATNTAKHEAQHALAVKYLRLASTPLYGHESGDTESIEDTAMREWMIRDIRAEKLGAIPEAYLARITVTDTPLEAVVNPGNMINMKINTRLMDNWQTDIMQQQVSVNVPPNDRLDTDTITGLHINPDGAVVPETIVLN